MSEREQARVKKDIFLTTKTKGETMKKVVLKSRIVALGIAALFTVSLTAWAISPKEGNNPSQIEYIGYINNQPVYHLALNNLTEGKYLISVRDTDGNVLHTEKLEGKKIERNYQFVDAPSDYYTLIFVINNLSTNKESVYKISKTNEVKESINVNKLK